MNKQQVIVKRPSRVVIAVDKKNCNRLKSGTHTLEKILKLEGHSVDRGCVMVGEQAVPLSSIDLTPKNKPENRVIPLVRKDSANDSAAPATATAQAN